MDLQKHLLSKVTIMTEMSGETLIFSLWPIWHRDLVQKSISTVRENCVWGPDFIKDSPVEMESGDMITDKLES